MFVLVNGCTDRTEAIIDAHARRDPAIHPVTIALGDKANAWNIYVHDLAPEAVVHFFVDGDVRIRPSSFRRLHEALSGDPRARRLRYPDERASRNTLAKQILEGAGFHGSLYALPGKALKALRAGSLRLLTGSIGDDSLLGWLLQRDFDPQPAADRSLILPQAEAGFEFRSLSPWRPGDWRLYYRRLRRNSLRQMQLNLLMPLLRE